MIERIRGATLYLAREFAILGSSAQRGTKAQSKDQNSAAVSSVLQNSLQEHQSFMRWYIKFLSNELLPTASYQRHIMALKAIQIVIKSGATMSKAKSHSSINAKNHPEWSFTVVIFTDKMIRLLLDLIMDPFEDVRASATDILKVAPPECLADQSHHNSPSRSSSLPISDEDNLRDRPAENTIDTGNPRSTVSAALLQFIERSGDASRRTGRADLADGVARSSELMCSLLVTDEARLGFLENLVAELEEKVRVAQKDLAEAVMLAPIHGHYSSLR